MRRLLPILAAMALAWGAVEAHSATVPFTGSLTIAFVPNVSLPTLQVPGSGIATVDGSHINALDLPASPFAATGITVMNPTVVGPVSGEQLTVHNGAGSFAGGPLGGPMPLNGVMKVCHFAYCGSAPPANLTVPPTVVGVGGSASVTALINVTVSGAPWTVGTAAVGTLTQMGFRHGPASLTSSTAAASGQVRLVTPIFISTSLQPESLLPTFGILDLHFVPEPGTLLLLGTGVAGLVMLGRTKRD
jgi:hypothetical protein